MTLVLSMAAPPTLAVKGGGDFPVRRIFCVGRNYAAHAREMGGDPTRESPFFFTKPADAIVGDGASIPYPAMSQDVHHEVELVVALGAGGAEMDAATAQGCIFGYAAGVDLTRRDLQAAAKKTGKPWDMAKGFDDSAPCGLITPRAEAGDVGDAAIWLKVNGELRQGGTTGDMTWKVPELLAELSRYVRLKAGDLIYTGTPEGVGPLTPGDEVLCHVDGLAELGFRIAPRS